MQYTGFVKGANFIKMRSQFKFVIYFCMSVLIGAVISVAVFYFYTYRELGGSHSQALLTLLGLRQNIPLAMVITGGLVVIFATLAVLLITLINSHEIAGPIYRLERSIESIGGGDFSIRTKFRKHDIVNGLADGINSASESLNAKITDISREIKEIRAEAERLKVNTDISPAILKEKIRLVRKTVSEFKID